MIRRNATLEAFEAAQRCRPGPSLTQRFRLYEALYEEARSLGVLPSDDPLEGIDVDIRRTRLLHALRTAPAEDRSDL